MKDNGACNQADRLLSILIRLQGPLIRYAMRITGNLDQARDVVQDTFLQLCSEDLAVLNGYLDPWLFTVCRNRALDVRRKENRMNALAGTQDKPVGNGIVMVLKTEETISEVLKILEGLPENQQEAIRLKFQNDLSYKEISQVTGLSVSNVGFLIHTGLKTIRQQLSAQASTTTNNLRRVK
jgi:RNA polymerase sigma factor (sigma-70 family)